MLLNWCWRRLLRVPRTARISNQSILKEINPEYSLEELILNLKLQYFGHLMGRADSLEETLMLGKTEGRRKMWQQKMGWLDGIINSVDMSLSKLWEIVKDRDAWHAPWSFKESDTTEWLDNNKCLVMGQAPWNDQHFVILTWIMSWEEINCFWNLRHCSIPFHFSGN